MRLLKIRIVRTVSSQAAETELTRRDSEQQRSSGSRTTHSEKKVAISWDNLINKSFKKFKGSKIDSSATFSLILSIINLTINSAHSFKDKFKLYVILTHFLYKFFMHL